MTEEFNLFTGPNKPVPAVETGYFQHKIVGLDEKLDKVINLLESINYNIQDVEKAIDRQSE